MIEKLYNIISLIILGQIILSCAKIDNTSAGAHVNDIFNYTLHDSIKLEESGFWYDGQRVNSNFLVVNKDDQRLEMFSDNGKLLSFVGKKGYGPGEFQNLTRFDVYEDDIYLIDKQKFTVSHIKLTQNNLAYVDEFKLLKQPTQICAINKNHLLITFMCDTKNLKLYTKDGELVKEYSIPNMENFQNDKELLSSGYWIDNISNTAFVLGNIAEMHLYFCTFDSLSNNVSIIKDQKMQFKPKKNRIILRNSNTFDVIGLSPITHSDNYYYVSPRSDMAGLSESFFEMYDNKGNYIGKSNLKEIKAVYKAISGAGDSLWFKTIDNYDYLYLMSKRDIDE